MEKMIKGNTLLEKKEFSWNFRVETGLIIEKEINGTAQILKFTTDELEEILKFIASKDEMSLGVKNDLIIERNPDNLGAYIFNNMRRKITEAEASKEIISILNETDLIKYEEKDGEILISITNENWEIDWKGKIRQLYVNKSL